MQYFIGIVPPIEYKDKIINFQKNWEDGRLPEVMEPHITVKAQGGLTPDKKWLESVSDLCKNISPFKVSLGKPMFFGEVVLFLSVESEAIYEFHKQIVEIIAPSSELIKKYFELENYTPHLTIAQANWGLSSEKLVDFAKLAETELEPYPTFEVNSIRIYHEVEPNKYEKYLDIPLKG